MFRPIKFVPMLMAASLFLSCSDDNDAGPESELPSEFSELTVEQNKENLENNGLELVSDLRALKNAAGIETVNSLNHFISVAGLPETGRKVAALQPVDLIRHLAAFAQGKTSAERVLKGMRGKETEPETIQELFDEYEGVFAYQAGDDTWTHTPGSDGKIAFQFPSTEDGVENDAEFVIYGLQTVEVNNTELEFEGDLPTALKADLSVDGTQQLGYTFAASYKNNGEPTSVETTLTIGDFTFSAKVVNTTQEVSVEYALVRGEKNLISLGAGATGNFSSSNFENSESPGSVINTADAYFQLVNIRIAGEINIKALDQALQGELTGEQEADAWNANARLVVFYADSKKKIADTEFYGTTRLESYYSCYDMNGDGMVDYDECGEVTYEYETVDVRLVFADGSKADLETYTEVGFEEIESEIEKFLDEVEADLD